MSDRSMAAIAREQAPGLPWREASDPHDAWDVAEFQAGIVTARAKRSPRGGIVVEAEVRDWIVTGGRHRLTLRTLAASIRAKIEQQAVEHAAETAAALAMLGGGRCGS